MARPLKKGLDYFPHDVHMKADQDVRLVMAKFGLRGYGLYNYLLELIYEAGYYILVDEEYITLTASECKISEDEFKEILDYFIGRVFDKSLWNKYTILTSQRIQLTYIEVMKRCKVTDKAISRQYRLIKLAPKHRERMPKSPVNATETSVNATETPVNVDETTQRKEKKRKEKERKENQTKEKKSPVNVQGMDGIDNIPGMKNLDDFMNGVIKTMNGNNTQDENFTKWINFYPRRDGDKVAMMELYKAVIRTDQDVKNLFQATRNYKSLTEDRPLKFLKLPVNFLKTYTDYVNTD